MALFGQCLVISCKIVVVKFIHIYKAKARGRCLGSDLQRDLKSEEVFCSVNTRSLLCIDGSRKNFENMLSLHKPFFINRNLVRAVESLFRSNCANCDSSLKLCKKGQFDTLKNIGYRPQL